MKSSEMVKEIRKRAGLSQTQLAKVLGVSFATVNRWENGHCEPTAVAINSLRMICRDNLIDFDELQKDAVVITSEKSLMLYHGSKRGIQGAVRPISSEFCDFGKGFYMGTNQSQPMSLICNFPEARMYTVKVDLTGLKILNLEVSIDWAMLIALNRGRMEDMKGTPYYEKFKNIAKDCDMISGYIVSDRMFVVLERFFSCEITDVALMNSLSALKADKQYAAVSERACKQIRIIENLPIGEKERAYSRKMCEANRAGEITRAEEICRKYRREGRYFDEILNGGSRI